MSWGTELWDQFDKVTEHTQKGIEFCEKYSHFTKDRAKIEQEYAANLRRLAKNYSPKKGKDDETLTLTTSFTDTLKEITDIAGQHDLLAESLVREIIQQMGALVSETKQERKKNMDDAKKLEAGVAHQHRVLDQSKQKYEKSYKEYCKADDIYRAADLNMQLSRAEVDKARNTSIQKNQACSDCKATYAQVLEKTNEHRRDYYNKTLPQVFQSLQDMDEKRVCNIRDSLKTFADLEKKIQPIVNTCLEGIVAASSKVDHEEDSRRVVDNYKSGFQPPSDVPFEDLNEDARSTGSNPQNHQEKEKRPETMGKSSKAAKSQKSRGGLKSIFGGRNAEEERDDFSHLNPQQQKKQLSKRVQAIKTSIAREVAAREAMTKMHDIYSKNSSLGDPAEISSQLEENKRKLDELDAELNQFENYLAAAESGNRTPTMQRRNSSGSYASVHSADNVSITPLPNNGAVQSSSGGNSLTVSQQQVSSANHRPMTADSFDNDSFDEAEEPETHGPALETATALFPFTATSVGAIDMLEQEPLTVIEHDTGDGWTRVRKGDAEEGFVPTTYIQID